MFIWRNLHLPCPQYILHLDEEWTRRTDLSPVTRSDHTCGMFGYPRRGGENRPSVDYGVAPPGNPTPSISDNSQGGYTNGRLQRV